MKNLTIKALIVLMGAITMSMSSTKPVEQRRAFCGFNLRDGYYYEEEELQFITREAKPGDKSGIPDVVEEIEKAIGVKASIKVYIAKDEDNCFATIAQGGQRILVADHLFLNRVNDASGTRWAAISVLAHEIGHHIAGFNRRSTALESELDADYWSGYALEKLGANQDASTKCIMHFGTEQDTDSHPNKYSRAETIRKGWKDAKEGTFDKDRCQSCK